MAKRRKITAPSATDLNKIEEEFRRETLNRANAGVAPISQIAGETAQSAPVVDAETRATQAKDKTDAEAFRSAESQGRLILDLPIDSIMEDAIVRDRMVLDAAEMEELKLSISANGLRLPIEVFAQDAGAEGKPYGLLSGYRRLKAIRDLYALTGQEKYATVKALVREPDALGGAFAAMVEENEIRASLSHFERGRIAVIAAQQGIFPSGEAAVAHLFSAASKAKRSKIRSFALIFEELGDMLEFPEFLKERDGLRVAAALRNGLEGRFRDVLAHGQPTSPEEEWALLETVVLEAEADAQPGKRGGRPKSKPQVGWTGPDTLRLSSGVVLKRQSDANGHSIRISGRGVDTVLIEEAMRQLAHLFDKP